MAIITQDALQRAQSGDLEAQAQLVRCYQSDVRSFVAMLTANLGEADDLAQETFLRAFTRLDRIHSPEGAGAYLRGIARNVALEHLRRQKMEGKRAQNLVHYMEDSVREGGAEEPWWSDDPALTDSLQQCLDALPPHSRTVLDWRYRDDYDATEIGARMDMRADAVRAMLKRLRLALWQCIQARMPKVLQPPRGSD